MKRLKLKCIISFLVSSVLFGLGAQTTMNVKVKSVTQSSFILTFFGGNLTVIKKDGIHTDFALTNALNLIFSDITSIAEIKNKEQSNMVLYPNPVVNKLQICYISSTEENVSLQIIDFQGKVIYLQNQQSLAGTNYLYISFEKYQDGMYLCRLQHGGNIEIKKFIKH